MSAHDRSVSGDFIDGMREFGVHPDVIAATEKVRRGGVPHDHREVVPGCFRCELSADETAHICPAYDGWGDFTCDLDVGHEGPHRDCGVAWVGEFEQERWKALAVGHPARTPEHPDTGNDR